MATPTTRIQFKTYCLRNLGFPVTDINVDDDQIEDRIDEALQFWQDYHYDGTEKLIAKHKITQEDYDRKWIPIPDAIVGITCIFPFDNSSASVNMFDLRYQLRLNELYNFTSVSYVPYVMTMQHIRSLNLMFSGTPGIRFNRHLNKLIIDVDWTRDVRVGSYVLIECYRKLVPDDITATGTASISSTTVAVVGNGTLFASELVIGDQVLINSESKRIVDIYSETSLNVDTAFAATASARPITKQGVSDVWGDRFMKLYGTALFKRQYGTNLKKFGNVQLPGGIVLNGQGLYDEAMIEIRALEEEMFTLNTLPGEMFIG